VSDKTQRDPVDVDDPRGSRGKSRKSRPVPDLSDIVALIRPDDPAPLQETYGVRMASLMRGRR
jgi:hypothetical protein